MSRDDVDDCLGLTVAGQNLLAAQVAQPARVGERYLRLLQEVFAHPLHYVVGNVVHDVQRDGNDYAFHAAPNGSILLRSHNLRVTTTAGRTEPVSRPLERG